MKKIKALTALAVSMAVLALALTSCSALLGELAQKPGDTPPGPVEVEDPAGIADIAPPDGQDPAAPQGPDTGAVDPASPLAHFTVFPEGDYLEERFRTSDPCPGYDFIPTFRGSLGSGAPSSCSTDTTYYYRTESPDGWSDILHYMDKATGISGPLCGKPECFHNDSTCNGYMGAGRCYCLSLYDGRIWWLDRGIGAEIHSCALDGTDHRLDLKISQDLVGTGGVPDLYFHRGTMYWVWTDNLIVGGVMRTRDEIIAFPLDGSDPYYVYRADPAVGGGYPSVFFLGDKMLLFFDMSKLSYAEDDLTVTDWQGATDIYLYDLNTRQVETLFSGETDFMMAGSWPVLREDGIYFVHGDIIEDGRWVPAARFLPWGGDTFEHMDFQSWYAYNFDGRFIFPNLAGDQLTVTEYTLDGRAILDRTFTVEYTGNPILLMMDGWDEDYYYIRLPSVHIAVATDAHALYYLDGAVESYTG